MSEALASDHRLCRRARTSPAASHRAVRVGKSMERMVRYSVESDGTAPNSWGWARRCSMSEHASPPPASEHGLDQHLAPVVFHRARRDLRRQGWTQSESVGQRAQGVQPDVGHDPSPPPFTTTAATLLPCISEVPSWFALWTCRQRQNRLPGEPLRGWAPLGPAGHVKNRG
jgi:hypothetical protein